MANNLYEGSRESRVGVSSQTHSMPAHLGKRETRGALSVDWRLRAEDGR